MKTWITRGALLLAWFVLVIPGLSLAEDKAPDQKLDAAALPAGVRTFTASHSFHWDMPDQLAELANASGIQGHKMVGNERIGGSRTLQHWNRPDAQNQGKQALLTGNIDVFTMAPIQMPDEGIRNYVKLGLEHNPKMRFTVQLSWAAYDIDMQDFAFSATNRVDPNRSVEQLKTLNQKNIKAAEEQVIALNKEIGRTVVYLVPSCQAHIALRIKIANKEIPGLTSQAQLFLDTLGHPTPPAQALNTYVHFAVIYGRTPVGLPMLNVLKNARNAAWDDKLNRTLQEIAWDTVTNYPLSGVTAPDAKPEVKSEDKPEVKPGEKAEPKADSKPEPKMEMSMSK